MTDTTIKIEELGKRYRIAVKEDAPKNWRENASSLIRSPFRYWNEVRRPPTFEETLWALRNVSFQVKRGEVVGIVGRNGAGKSTLLKILSRITEPTEGRVTLNGRIGSLLEVGTGFHPDLTGRENTYLNGAILGMRKREIDRKFEEIVAFAEVERFIDTPVKRYSSGMYVRLAFAVAAHLQPEILILDEVLAVGDNSFKKKCLDKMGQVAREGRTILFVSHNLGAIQELCSRCIWLNAGKVRSDGDTEQVLNDYIEDLDGNEDGPSIVKSPDGSLEIERVFLRDEQEKITSSFPAGSPITIEILYNARSPIISPYFWLAISTPSSPLFIASMMLDGFHPSRIYGRGRIRCTFPSLPLMPSPYLIRVGAYEKDGRTQMFNKTDVAHFRVTGAAKSIGFEGDLAERFMVPGGAPVLSPYVWELDDGQSFSVNPFHATDNNSFARVDLPLKQA